MRVKRFLDEITVKKNSQILDLQDAASAIISNSLGFTPHSALLTRDFLISTS